MSLRKVITKNFIVKRKKIENEIANIDLFL